ncbi:HU family DNA-binding protein [Plantactinospora sp. BB1]|uniref:HU family DNA-binding protein n=1 Tax=Plantactinospora sp. BB1 TaxID=2071627 RepID=UPI000D16CC6F|nr:HU family DNA-binding protein [Plantactinospora sp. BB1]AVT37329.1 DNA-binding protein [Plantactinospora sp. BB1]
MNKAELIEALAARLGDRKTATSALDAVLAEVQAAVTKGDRVAITGFGVFEKRVRGARTARNPRTGESVKVKKTSVPAFRPGAGFKEMVASGKAPKNTVAAKKSATASTAKSTVAKKTTTKKAAPAKTTATKAAAKKTAPAKKATGGTKATTAKKTTAAKKSTAAKSTSTRATASKKASTAKKAPAKKAAKR